MRTFAAIFIAFFALTAPATVEVAAAASASDAIQAWAGALAGTNWKVTTGNVAYDQPTDRTTVTGFKATSPDGKVTIGFDTIVMTGYAQTPDGGFSLALFRADGGSVDTGMGDVAISGLTATDFSAPAMTPVTFDKDHPFSSVAAIYANLLKIHLAHAGVDSVKLENTSDNAEFSYSKLAIDNWTNGKIGNVTIGPTDLSFDDDNGDTVRISVGDAESRDTDLNTIVNVYDPTRYANGVGDMIWHQAIGSIAYHDLSVDSADFSMTMGGWTISDIKMRQPAHTFTPALDAIAAAGDQADLGPDGTRAMFDMWSAFSLGKFSLTDLEVNGNDGYGSLSAFTIADFSADGLGEISFDNLDVNIPDSGFAKIERLAAGNFVFPGVDKLVAAFDADQRGEDVDYGSLSAKLGYIEAASVDIQTPLSPEVSFDKFRLDLSNYVGIVPTSIGVDLAGLSVPLDPSNDEDKTLLDLDYDAIHASAGAKVTWNEADQTVSIDGLHVALGDVGTVTGSAVFGGLSRDMLTEIDSLVSSFDRLKLVSSSVSYMDDSLFNRWIAQQAYEMGVEQGDFRQQLVDMVADQVKGIGDAAFNAKLVDALKTFIQRPGTVTVTAKPASPVSRTSAMLVGVAAPGQIPSLLGLDIKVAAGPEPEPFDYVPFAQPSPPSTDDDYRHIPLKKK